MAVADRTGEPEPEPYADPRIAASRAIMIGMYYMINQKRFCAIPPAISGAGLKEGGRDAISVARGRPLLRYIDDII